MGLANRKLRWLVGITVMPLCLYLSLHLFKLSSNLQPLEESSLFLRSSELGQIKKLRLKATELRDQQSFMVFNKEKKLVERLLVNNLKEQINLRPFETQLWRELMFLQVGDTNSDDSQWTFSVALKLMQWNPHEQITFLKRCEYFTLDASVDVSKACAYLFREALLKDGVDSLARQLSIKKTYLKNVLLHFDVELEEAL